MVWTNTGKSSTILPKSIQNRSKITIKSIKMDLGTVLAPGTEHATPRLFQECPPEEIPGAFGHCFREDVAPRVVFRTPRDPKMGPKSHFWGKIGAWTLQKWSPGGVPENVRKTHRNFDGKLVIFEVPEPQKSYPCVHRDTIFTFSTFREQNEKDMKNGGQKVIVDAERHRRTPRPWATSGKTIYVRMLGLIQIDSMRDTGRKLATLAIKGHLWWKFIGST